VTSVGSLFSLFSGGFACWYAELKFPYGKFGRKNNIEIIASPSARNNQIVPQLERKLKEYQPPWFYAH
jgi:hypothetical protein